MKYPLLFSPLAIVAILLVANATVCTTASAQIVTTNLNLYLNSSTGVTTVSGNVSSWADQSGSGYNAVQGTAGSRPAYVTTGTADTTPTGQASLHFDGIDDNLLGSMGSLTYADVFVVGRLNSANTSANEGVLSMTAGNYDTFGNAALVWSSGHSVANTPTGADSRWDGGGGPSTEDAVLALDQWYVYEYRVTDAGGGNVNESLFYRGLGDASFVQLGSSTFAASSTVNLTQYLLGGRLYTTPNYFADVDIASVLVYNGALTTGDQTQVRGTLYNLYIVPEPQTWALAALGAFAVLFRLRRQQRSA